MENGLFDGCPRTGTYCSNPEVTHTVTTGDPRFGYGIFGYYLSEWDAYQVLRFLRQRDCANASVNEYDPNEEVRPGIHPLIEANFSGLI